MLPMNDMVKRDYFVRLALLMTVSFFTFGTYRNWPYKIESDGKYYYQYLISLFFDHDIDFTNNYSHPRHDWMRTEIDHYDFKSDLDPKTGRPGNVFSVGPAILWFPFFVVSYLMGFLFNSILATNITLDGWSRFFQYSVMYSGVLYSLCALWMIHRLLRRHFSASAANLALVAVLLGTNLYYYSIFEVSMSHVYDLFTAVLFIYLFSLTGEHPNSTRLFVATGLAGGLHTLVRPQNAITVGVVSCFLLGEVVRKRHAGSSIKVLANLIAYGGAILAAMSPLLLINNYLYGSFLTVPQGQDFLHLTRPNIWGVLFSTRNGLFSHHPVLLLGLIGFAALIIQSVNARAESRSFWLMLGIILALQIYINASTGDWWAGHSFGQRRLIGSYLPFAYGLAQMIVFSQDRIGRPMTTKTVYAASIINGYLTFIHVFVWSYDEPHNILYWIIVVPARVLIRLAQMLSG